MSTDAQAPGIAANASAVKNFVKTVIQSNQRFERWNEEHHERIATAELARRKKVPVCIWGPHGIGKTELLKALADELTHEEGRSHADRWLFTNIAPAQFEEMGDLLGMPAIDPGVLDDPSDDKTILVPPEWTPFKVEQARREQTGQAGPGIFLIDDVNRADMRIISGLMQLLQDYELASWKMPDDWHIVLTANPPGGDYIVRELDDAMMTRMMHIQMHYDEKVWARWAEQQGMDARGISFVLGYPELMTGKRTTPRTLVQFFNAIESVGDLTDPGSIELVATLGRSCLDPETVAEFLQFIRNDWSKIIQPEDILDASNFQAIEKRMQQLIAPAEKQGAKRVDLANIIMQRMINKIILMRESFTQGRRDNTVRFMKLPVIPLDLRVAAGRDLYGAAISKRKDDALSIVTDENRAMIATIFEDAELARDILSKML